MLARQPMGYDAKGRFLSDLFAYDFFLINKSVLIWIFSKLRVYLFEYCKLLSVLFCFEFHNEK